jgi:hypothetical protein
MALGEASSATMRSRHALVWLLALAVIVLYLLLPDADERTDAELARDEAGDEIDRLEILSVSPPDPYPGSSLRIRYEGLPAGAPLHVYAGKSELPLLAHRPGEAIASLPRGLSPGDLKVKISAGVGGDKLPRALRSKSFHVRVKAPNLRKVFRNLIGGLAFAVLGIGLMARGVRETTGVAAARAVTRAARVRSVAYGFGALTGALVQSTTSAASVLAALSSSGVLPLAPAGLAFLGAQCGAAIAPLLVTGLLEPREGLIAVAIGVLWLGLALDRRGAALGRLVLGVGFVAYGLQLLKPAFEPFVSDPMLMSLADSLRADNAVDVVLCAALGSALVALLQGPAPLIVLILAVAQTTGRWDLTTALALLSGTGLGASVAALLTASAGTQARLLARLHLMLGAISTLVSASTVMLWSGAAERILQVETHGVGDVIRAPLHELGGPLALAFGLSQLASALLVTPLSSRLAARALERELAASSQPKAARSRPGTHAGAPVATALAHALELQQGGLDALAVLAQTGARSFGGKAEHALADARAALSRVVQELVHEQLSDGAAPDVDERSASGAAAFACLQLQNALEALLSRAERGTEARLQLAETTASATPWDDQLVLRELHELISEGLAATRASLATRTPLDLDEARAREIKINRLESHARRMSNAAGASAPRFEQQLELLRVIDAYEVVGNQVYRLAEAMEQAPSLA